MTALSGTRRRTLAALLAVLLLTGVVLAAVLGGRQDDGPSGAAPAPSASPAPSTSPAPSASPAPSSGSGGAAEPTGSPAPQPVADAPPPVLPAVALDEDATAGDGVTAAVRSLETIQGEGHGPGQVDGPALRVTVELRNGTAAALSLDGVSVNVATGADALPASPIDDPSVRLFAGQLAAGESATAVYVFTVQGGGAVTVEVGHRAGAPLLVFTGTP